MWYYCKFSWPGMFASIAFQVLFFSQFHGCLDKEGGYYLHIFAPTLKVEKAKETKATEQAVKGIEDTAKTIGEGIDKLTGGNKENLAKKSFDEVILHYRGKGRL